MKKIFITLMCIVMVVCFMPTVAMAGGEPTAMTGDEFIALAGGEGNIVLDKDINLTSTVEIDADESITLDLNGHTVTATTENKAFCILEAGRVIVKDSSTEQIGKITNLTTSKNPLIHVKGGYFELKSGTLENNALNNYTLWVNSGGVANITGGKVSNSVNYGYAIFTSAEVNISGGEVSNSKGSGAVYTIGSGTINISGGKVSSERGYAVYTIGNSTTNISGGEVSNSKGSGAVYTNGSGTTNITGGKVSSERGDAVSTNGNSTTNISGGEVSNSKGSGAVSTNGSGTTNITGGKVYSGGYIAAIVTYSGATNITGGEVSSESGSIVRGYGSGTTNITGGTFSSDVSQYVPEGTKVVETTVDDVTKYTLAPITEGENAAVAKVGDAGFTTLQAAINAAADGQTVTLLSDVGPITETTLYIDKNLTLDLGGKTLTIDVKGIGDKNPRYSFIVNDNINFTLQNGTLNNPSGRGIFVLKNSTITVAKDAKIETAGSALVGSNNKAEEGHVTFNVYGTLDCNDIGVWGMGPNNTFNLDGATITSKYFGVYQNGSFGGCIINIKNSTITDEKEDGVAVYISNNKGNAENSKQGMQELTIENSIITGATAVEAKYTNINIKGSRTKITATGTPVNTTLNNNGPVTTGYAIAVTHNGAINKENGSVSPDSARGKITIEGGTFNGLIGIQEPLNETTKAEISISGGKFTQKLPSEYLVPGVVQNSNGTVYKPYYGGSIPTDSLKTARTEAIKAVTDYVNPADYEEAQQAEIKTIVDNAKKNIEVAKTADEIKAIEAAAKAELDKLETAEEMSLIRAIGETKFVARSKAVTLKNGKKAIKITWYDKNGKEVKFDGVEIFRSTKRYSGYGKEPIYVSKSGVYYNTAIEAGTKYYYKVRGYVLVNGEKVYTDYSTKAWRTVK